MKVTFDSNAYRQAVDPARSCRDASLPELQKIHDALKNGAMKGYLSETLATLEGVQNAQRGAYFSSVMPKVKAVPEALPGGGIKIGLTIGADDDLHPGLHPIVARWVGDAMALGLKFLYAPRISAPRPSDLAAGSFEVEDTEPERKNRQELFFKVGREIDARGVGFAKIKQIAERIRARSKSSAPWYSLLNMAIDEREHREIQKAVSEWADGDTIAAHIGYKIDLLCAGDKGQSAGAGSVFDAANRLWLEQTYGVQFVTLSELAAGL